jgi:hygromycin-B 7''-O-kinase
MSGLLPAAEDVDRLRHQAAVWLPAIQAIAAQHGGGEVRPNPMGMNVVFAVGEDRFLKLFAPQFAVEQQAEQIALQRCAGRLSVAVPAIVAAGTWEGWPYLLVERVPGQPAATLWPTMSRRARSRALHQLGGLIAELGELDCTGLDADWATYQRDLARTAVERQRKLGTSSHLLAELPTLLRRPPPPSPAVFLHADLTEENVLLDADGHITALIDFGDARQGPSAYDLVTPLMQLAGTDQRLAAALLDGTGSRPDPDALLYYTALHHYNDLSRFPGESLRGLVECWC